MKTQLNPYISFTDNALKHSPKGASVTVGLSAGWGINLSDICD